MVCSKYRAAESESAIVPISVVLARKVNVARPKLTKPSPLMATGKPVKARRRYRARPSPTDRSENVARLFAIREDRLFI